MTDAHCHVSAGDPSVRELLIGRDFVGIHPWESGKVGEWEGGRVGKWEGGRVGEWEGGRVGEWEGGTVEAWLRARLEADPRRGVGEIGLDRLKAREIPSVMRAVFEAQLRVAMELGLPVVLHGAKCWGQVVQAIRAFQHLNPQTSNPPTPQTSKHPNIQTSQHPNLPNIQTSPTFLFHGFSRSDGLIPDIVALGGYISVGPAVLNDHAVNYRVLVKKIPLDRLLVETDRDDAPETCLNPLTGAPLSVRDVLAKTAELRGLAAAELEAITDANALAFCRVGHPYPGFSDRAMADRPVVRRCGAGSCSLRAFSGDSRQDSAR